jgi:hypothetical protein
MLRERIAWTIAGVLALAVAASLAGVVESGPLDPPGAPSSTDSVRLPGTPITSLPVTLDQPGHYYVTRNLGSATGGISITTSDVSVDLGGFTLSGPGATGTGIQIDPLPTRTVIRNGTVHNWQFGIRQIPGEDNESEIVIEHVTVSDTASQAISVQQNARIRECQVIASGGIGIHVSAGPALIEDCSVNGAVTNGIQASFGTVVRNCDVTGVTAPLNQGVAVNLGTQSVVESCRIHGNSTSAGLFVASDTRAQNVVVEGNTLDTDAIRLFTGGVLRDCVVRGNTAVHGISASSDLNVVDSCSVDANSGIGIRLGDRSIVRNSTATSNGGDGIVVGAGSRVESSTAADNTGDGIEASTGVHIVGNVLRFNDTAITDGAGIHLTGSGNYVEDNSLHSNDIGIRSDVAPNVIVHNSARNHVVAHYQLQATDLAGVIITTANEALSSVPHWNDTP